MEATANLNLRADPPSGIFNVAGDKIGTVERGDQVIANDQKTVRNLFGNYKWYKVDVFDPTTGKVKASGWVYAGEAGDDGYLKPVRANVALPTGK